MTGAGASRPHRRIEWGRIFARLAGEFGWTYAEIGALTMEQIANALSDGGLAAADAAATDGRPVKITSVEQFEAMLARRAATRAGEPGAGAGTISVPRKVEG